MKRKDFLGVLTAAVASTPIRSLAQGHGPADPDKFDFDASRSRPSVQEALTTLVRKIGDFVDHKDFVIYFTGSQPLEVNGTRASIKAMNPDGTPAAIHRPSFGGLSPRPPR